MMTLYFVPQILLVHISMNPWKQNKKDITSKWYKTQPSIHIVDSSELLRFSVNILLICIYLQLTRLLSFTYLRLYENKIPQLQTP